MLQATEALKFLAGIGEPLAGRLWHIDALTMRVREFKLRRDAGCVVCGENPSITAPIDYDAFVGGSPPCPLPSLGSSPSGGPSSITVHELAAKLADPVDDLVVLDVREAWEVSLNHLDGSVHIPLGELPQRCGELPAQADIYVHCKAGGRSARAVALLKQRGFHRVTNVAGGLDAWQQEIDPARFPFLRGGEEPT